VSLADFTEDLLEDIGAVREFARKKTDIHQINDPEVEREIATAYLFVIAECIENVFENHHLRVQMLDQLHADACKTLTVWDANFDGPSFESVLRKRYEQYRKIFDIGATQLPEALRQLGEAVTRNAWPQHHDTFVESTTIGLWLGKLMIPITKFCRSVRDECDLS
jgi:hypothetical protein